ncbi:tetraspanin-10 isoform X2 [Rhinolophus sinicus]|uniref:tetraspanin-10 isoform X2 n=1 Tax=Rhinolophus sinicus TaxID=89399 RepID=UPI003D7B91C3
MKEGERSPLLSQDAVGQEPPLSKSSQLTPCHLGPALQERWAWRPGLGGGQAPSLPWGSSCVKTAWSTPCAWPSPTTRMTPTCSSSWTKCSSGCSAVGLPPTRIGSRTCESCSQQGGGWPPATTHSCTHTHMYALTCVHTPTCTRSGPARTRWTCGDPNGEAQPTDLESHFWGFFRYFNCSSPGIQACSLPASCCIDPREDGASINDQCGSGALGLDEDAAQRVVHLEGCGTPLREWLRRNMRAVGGLAIAVVVVQGAELLLATRLVRALTVRKGAAESSGVGGAAAPVHPGRGPRDLPAPKSAPE